MYKEENETNIARDSEQNIGKQRNGMPLTPTELKERISFAALLRADGIKVIPAGSLMECRCPVPEHPDTTPSFKIFNDQRAYCFGCSWSGDIIDYVRTRDKCDFNGACEWLEARMGEFPRTAAAKSSPLPEGAGVGVRILTAVERERCSNAARFLAEEPLAWHQVAFERDWNPETIGRLAQAGDLGWHRDQLAFIYENGMKVRDWPGRNFRWNCGGPSLWRGHLLNEEVGAIFIAEGETDGISLIDGDVENCGGTVVAIPSSTTIRAEWFGAMKDQVVILCFDNDDAGRLATRKVAKMLENVAATIRFVDFGATDYHDISDAHQKMGQRKFFDWLSGAIKPWTPGPSDDDDDGGKAPKAPAPKGPARNDPDPGSPTPAGELPRIYYAIGPKEYFVEAGDGTWIPVNENSVKRHLKEMGFKHGKEDGATVTPMEAALNEIQRKQSVAYAAPLAGHDAGLYAINGANVLATQSPKFIAPVPGEFPILREMLRRMFVLGERDQLLYLYAWLKVHLACFESRKWHPHQALAFCGPVDCGKSLLQRLISQLFGGRSAKPHQFMSGGTNFNADIFEAEHLMIEDDAEATQHKERKQFGAHVKAFAANRDQRCHGKFSKGLILHPLWAVTISVNDEPQRLLVLPPIDQDTEDKIILLRVNQCRMPMDTETLEQKDRFWNTLLNELPAFVAFLHQWEIPNELRSAKYGVKHYHDPDILRAVDEVSNELRLLTLIDLALPFTRGESWIGTAHDLEHQLCGTESKVQYDARKLFYFPTACGTYLSNLAKKCPERVVKAGRSNNTREWQIKPMPGRHYPGQVFSGSPGKENEG